MTLDQVLPDFFAGKEIKLEDESWKRTTINGQDIVMHFIKGVAMDLGIWWTTPHAFSDKWQIMERE